MANIQPQVDRIRRAVVGEEVRESIASGLEAMNQESSEAIDKAVTAQDSAINSAGQAAQSATEAANSAYTAGQAEQAALNTITTIAGYATTAENAKDQALNYANAAASAATDANTSKTQSQAIEQRINSQAATIDQAVADARSAATDANTSKNQAEQAASNAQTSATTATNAASSAANNATSARDSATNAYNYAQQAQAAANVQIATTSVAGIVMPDGSTITVDQYGRISATGIKDHIDQSIFSAQGVHGSRVYTDPTTKLVALQKWDSVAQAWETIASGLKPDGTSITMDPDGTLHAKSGHELVTTKEELENITKTGEKVVEAFLVKTLIHEGAAEYSEIHVHTSDATLFGKTVTATLTYNVEGLTETVTGTIDSTGYASLKVYNVGTYTINVEGTQPQTVVISSFTVVVVNVEKFSAEINLNLGQGADVTGQSILVKASDGGAPIQKVIAGAAGYITVNKDNTTFTLSGTITDARGFVANSSIDTVSISGATGPYNASLKFAKFEITVACTTSAEITLTKGVKTITYAMSEPGTQTFSNYFDVGEWSISGQIDGETITDTIGGQEYKLYTKELSVSSAIITINGSVDLAPTMPVGYIVPEGYYKPNSVDGFMVQLYDATSLALIDTQTFSNEKATFTVDTRQHTNVKVVYVDEDGFTKPADVTQLLIKGQSYVLTPKWVEKWAKQIVTTNESDLLTKPVNVNYKVNKTITGQWDSKNECEFIIKEQDQYSIECDSATASVNVLDSQLDGRTLPTVTLSTSQIYGVSRTWGASSTAWDRTDAAVGFLATASVGSTAGSSDFDSIYPWSDMKRETLSTGDVMVKIPTFYYKRYVESNVEHIQISGTPADGFIKHPGSGRYVGAYKTSSNNRSLSGVAPQVSQTRATMRTNARAKGTGWSLIDEATHSAIRMLYLVEFADSNCQVKIGRGYVDGNSAALNSGTTNSLPTTGIYLTGRVAGTDGKTDICYRGIEGFWGNIWEFVDGFNISDGKYYICTDPSKYADDTAIGYTLLGYSGQTNWSGSYITKNGVDTSNSWADLPLEAGTGTENTGYADACWSSTGWRVALRSGHWIDASHCGFWILNASNVSSIAGANVGSRLLYSPS